MLRRKVFTPPAFYAADAVRAKARNFYTQLALFITPDDWAAWATPLEAAFCADNGAPVDPIVYLKIYLIGYLENITYDTDLAERLHDSLGIREFLGYALDESTPAHDAISRVRRAVAVHCDIDAVLAAIVARCCRAGLVSGQQVAIDSCLLPANASIASLTHTTTGQPVAAYLRETKAANPTAKVTVENALFRSTTDPDARLTRKDGQPRDMYYRVTHATDSRALIILAARADMADTGEPDAALPAVRTAAVTLRRQQLPRGVCIGDAGYDAGDFHRAVRQCGFTPLTNYHLDEGGKPPGWQKADFRYAPTTDTYQCPQGHPLRYAGTDAQKARDRYRSDPARCATCPDRAACLAPGARVRLLSRQHTEAQRTQVIALCHTPAGQAALKARKHIVEPPFGHMQTYGGLQLVNCRGRDPVHVKTVLAAVAWNLIALINALKRRRPTAPIPRQDVGTGCRRIAGFARSTASIPHRGEPERKASGINFLLHKR